MARKKIDVLLIGAGIMSATLGTILKKLDPNLKIEIVERLSESAQESSAAWNNAGTGHSGYCELNYTPIINGEVNIEKAVKTCSKFFESKQFWSSLIKSGEINVDSIRDIPHISFVWGEDNVNFLRKRYQAMSKSHLFKSMEYTEDRNIIEKWIPLSMKDRPLKQPVAATKVENGKDVNFGDLTNQLIKNLTSQPFVDTHFNYDVLDINRKDDYWVVNIKDRKSKKSKNLRSKFVFIGAGGATLNLLNKANIPESIGYGGFPVSGQWLKCINKEVIEQHNAKVYGKAAVGAPPMSVPHLDTRFIDGEVSLLFGPYAGFSTKFLKSGSRMDLFKSIKKDNIKYLLSAGVNNLSLSKYLITEVLKSESDKIELLKEYYPNANPKDWVTVIAGQRVQVIKKNKKGEGILEFGTEVINSKDGTLAALLGASPGASTSPSIMIDVIKKCFPHKMVDWETKIKDMIPSYGLDTNKEEIYNEINNKLLV